MGGYHRIGGATSALGTPTYRAHDPRTGQAMGDRYADATAEEITRAVDLAVDAAPTLAAVPSGRRGELLVRLADQLERQRDRLVAQADLETGLGTEHLTAELAACCAHLRTLGQAVGRGMDVEAHLATAAAADAGGRTSAPVHRRGSLWTGIGPAVVVDADAAPFVLGVPGIDTASALAAGCPVIGRASAHHPATAQACAAVVDGTVRELGWPAGSHALLHGERSTVTEDLVAADGVAAVAFTGGAREGRALADLAVARPEPIRFHGRYPTVNPVVLTPQALAEDAQTLAAGIGRACTTASGQDLLRPGVLVVPDDVASDWFIDAVAVHLRGAGPHPLLGDEVHAAFTTELSRRLEAPGVTLVSDRIVDMGSGFTQQPVLLLVGADDVLADPGLVGSCVGPLVMVVRAPADRVVDVIEALPHSPVAHLHRGPGVPGSDHAAIVAALAARADHVVEGGPPATVSAPGAAHLLPPGDPWGLRRWQRVVSYEGVHDNLRPPALQDGNPLGIVRTVDGRRTGGSPG